jgi:hypothetical protein
VNPHALRERRGLDFIDGLFAVVGAVVGIVRLWCGKEIVVELSSNVPAAQTPQHTFAQAEPQVTVRITCPRGKRSERRMSRAGAKILLAEQWTGIFAGTRVEVVEDGPKLDLAEHDMDYFSGLQ